MKKIAGLKDRKLILVLFLFLSILQSCQSKPSVAGEASIKQIDAVELEDNSGNPIPGAEQMHKYLPLLEGKKIGLVVNHTAIIENVHLLDTLLSMKMDVVKIFSPEHGFRGDADAGEMVNSQIDAETGIPVFSLYGKTKKPTAESLQDIDVLVFDIQDVGARFYTYISTLHYIMESAAENNVQVIILDRPNPNGHYVDGPVLDMEHKSFIGMHPVPIVHGMTIGEYAGMINGEGWLSGGIKCDLVVINCDNYSHNSIYEIPIKPSPNLPNQRSIYLYPSLCLFEGTMVSVGRGTDKPFQVFGQVDSKSGDFTFIPESKPGAKKPFLEGKVCVGYDLSNVDLDSLRTLGFNLSWLIEMYNSAPEKAVFFLSNGFFEKLAGTKALRQQIEAGLSEDQIRKSWENDLSKYLEIRKKYLLYPDFS